MAILTETQVAELKNHPRYSELEERLEQLTAHDLSITEENIAFAFRAINDFDSAIIWYEKALKKDPEEQYCHLGLGIIYQLKSDWPKAFLHLEKAAQNSSFIEAWISLGLTYKKMGRKADALKAYREGVKNMTLIVLSSLVNDRANVLYPHMSFGLWQQTAANWVMEKVKEAKLEKLRFPTPETAVKLMSDNPHGGLLWIDEDGIRSILPNFFNTIAHKLRADMRYATLLNNIGTVHGDLGQKKQASEAFQESIDYTPEGVIYDNPRLGLGAIGG